MKKRRIAMLVVCLLLCVTLLGAKSSEASFFPEILDIKGDQDYPFHLDDEAKVVFWNDETKIGWNVFINPDDMSLVDLVLCLPNEYFELIDVKVSYDPEKRIFESFIYEGREIKNLEDIPDEWVPIFSRSLYTTNPPANVIVTDSYVDLPQGRIYITQENNSFWVVNGNKEINVPLYSIIEFRGNVDRFYVVLLPGSLVVAIGRSVEGFLPNITVGVSQEGVYLSKTGYTWFNSKPIYYLNNVMYRQYGF